MESKANYTLIGIFVLIALFSITSFTAYLSGRGLSEKLTDYIVVYTTPPRGISVGSEVRYNGLKMGEVTDTRLDPEDENRVLVHIRVKETTPVLQDTYGQLEPLGLTGLSYIQLFPGKSTKPIERQTMFGAAPQISGRASQFDDLLGGSESVIENVNLALGRAASIMNPEATQNLHEILANINAITNTVAKSNLSDDRIETFMAAIETAAKDVSTAALAVDVTAKDISKFMNSGQIDTVLNNANQALVNADGVLSEYKALATHGVVMTDEATRMIEQFTATGLQDLSTSMTALRDLIETLSRITNDLERNPLAFVIGEKREVTELPQ